jgi:signal transduction histidine kinase
MIDGPALAVLGLHLLYAMSLHVAAAFWPTLRVRMAPVVTVADVFFGVAVAVVTEGVTSPAYAFFAFAILAVGCRMEFRVILAVTASCVALYSAIILASAQDGADVYMMRPAYLAITGYLIAYLAQRRLECERRVHEAETRADRHGIARALHDGYVQALAAVNLRLGNCRTLLDRGRRNDVEAELTALQLGVRREYDDVRAYVRSLAALECRDLDAASMQEPRCTVVADLAGSGIVVEHVLQIMLEGIRNARRHARAASTAIAATTRADSVCITIEDDGVGFGHEADVPWTIASRVRDCGGVVRIASPLHHGARLVVEVPGA